MTCATHPLHTHAHPVWVPPPSHIRHPHVPTDFYADAGSVWSAVDVLHHFAAAPSVYMARHMVCAALTCLAVQLVTHVATLVGTLRLKRGRGYYGGGARRAHHALHLQAAGAQGAQAAPPAGGEAGGGGTGGAAAAVGGVPHTQGGVPPHGDGVAHTRRVDEDDLGIALMHFPLTSVS